jgi:hypothetical protein
MSERIYRLEEVEAVTGVPKATLRKQSRHSLSVKSLL